MESIPDGWEKCSLGIEMRGFLLYRNEISWNLWRSHGFKEISILYWFSLGIYHPGSGEVTGSLPGSCRIPWNSI